MRAASPNKVGTPHDLTIHVAHFDLEPSRLGGENEDVPDPDVLW